MGGHQAQADLLRLSLKQRTYVKSLGFEVA